MGCVCIGGSLARIGQAGRTLAHQNHSDKISEESYDVREPKYTSNEARGDGCIDAAVTRSKTNGINVRIFYYIGQTAEHVSKTTNAPIIKNSSVMAYGFDVNDVTFLLGNKGCAAISQKY